jgi:hypothetical protein
MEETVGGHHQGGQHSPIYSTGLMLYMRCISAVLLVISVVGLDNGLARIPDRGWNSVRA